MNVRNAPPVWRPWQDAVPEEANIWRPWEQSDPSEPSEPSAAAGSSGLREHIPLDAHVIAEQGISAVLRAMLPSTRGDSREIKQLADEAEGLGCFWRSVWRALGIPCVKSDGTPVRRRPGTLPAAERAALLVLEHQKEGFVAMRRVEENLGYAPGAIYALLGRTAVKVVDGDEGACSRPCPVRAALHKAGMGPRQKTGHRGTPRRERARKSAD